MGNISQYFYFQVFLSVIGISLTDSTLNKDGLQLSKVNESDTDRVQRSEVWGAVSQTLDSFLFPESKPPQVIFRASATFYLIKLEYQLP